MSRRLSTVEFINRAQMIHPESNYDYSEVVYIDNKTPVRINCATHGSFRQVPREHLYGKGCRRCGVISGATMRSSGRDAFIRRSRELFGDLYGYDLVEYSNNKSVVRLVCRDHGEFSVRPDGHLSRGRGCPECGGSRRLTTAEFVERAVGVHGDRYDYGDVAYQNMHTEVVIVCREHGKFKQIPATHLGNHGCPRCVATPRGEAAIAAVLEAHNIEFLRQWRDHDCVLHIRRLAFDFALPAQRVLIEFDGLQHYQPVRWSSSVSQADAEREFGAIQARDRAKELWAVANGWALIRLTSIKTVPHELQKAGVLTAAVPRSAAQTRRHPTEHQTGPAMDQNAATTNPLYIPPTSRNSHRPTDPSWLAFTRFGFDHREAAARGLPDPRHPWTR